jgi:hypothetical protein
MRERKQTADVLEGVVRATFGRRTEKTVENSAQRGTSQFVLCKLNTWRMEWSENVARKI